MTRPLNVRSRADLVRRVLRDTRHIWQEEAVGRYGRHYGAGGEFIAAGGVWWRSAAGNDTTGTEDGSRDRERVGSEDRERELTQQSGATLTAERKREMSSCAVRSAGGTSKQGSM